jgi:hypothetical protein
MNPHAGGRVVFRHNKLIDQNTGGHGTEGARHRGMRSFEIYQNEFETKYVMNKCIQLRGGTGVVWGNTAKGTEAKFGYANFVVGLNFRSFTNYTTNFKKCDGTNPWDENSNSTGYAALDQVGRGVATDKIRGNPPVNQTSNSARWPRNQKEPVYVWENNWTPVPNTSGAYIKQQDSPCIVIGRDIIDGRMPGYSPYVYPHPLVSGSGPLPSPVPTPAPSATILPSATPSSPPVTGTPAPPTDLVATAADDPTKVNIRWVNAENIKNTVVERSLDDGTTFDEFTTIASTRSDTFDGNRVAGETYWYRTRHTDDAGKRSEYSNVASATAGGPSPTASPTAVPTATATVAPTATPQTITIQPGETIIITAPKP